MSRTSRGRGCEYLHLTQVTLAQLVVQLCVTGVPHEMLKWWTLSFFGMPHYTRNPRGKDIPGVRG